MAKTRPEITQAIREARRWTAQEAAAVLAAADESGLSVRAFAAHHGLVAQRLGWWRRRLRAASPTEGTFIEVAPLPQRVADVGASGFEIALPNGRVVRVGSGFDAEELRRLLAVVDEASC